MIRRPIFSTHNRKGRPFRLCDVLVRGNQTYLELKRGKGKNPERVPWEDIVHQVNQAQKDDRQQELP